MKINLDKTCELCSCVPGTEKVLADLCSFLHLAHENPKGQKHPSVAYTYHAYADRSSVTFAERMSECTSHIA